MHQSESIANLAKALSTVQGKLTYAKKDSKNPFFKSNYADLESVWDPLSSSFQAASRGVLGQTKKNIFLVRPFGLVYRRKSASTPKI